MVERELPKRKIRLLVADRDGKHFCDLVKFADIMGNELDFECKFAPSSRSMFSLMKNWEPNVVLLDVYLSDTSALEILDRCNEASPPIVITSDYQLENLRDLALAKGATAFITKSDNPEDLEILFYTLADISSLCVTKH